MLNCTFVASLDAVRGSVITYDDLISPFRRGFNHSSFCSAVPYLASTSMLPVSGAELFVAYANHQHLGRTKVFLSLIEPQMLLSSVQTARKLTHIPDW